MPAAMVSVRVLDADGVVRTFAKWSDDGTPTGVLYDVYVDPDTFDPISAASTVPVAGADAHGEFPADDPFAGAIIGRTSPATAVSNGQLARATGSIHGEQLAIGALREMKVRQKSIITNDNSAVPILTADATYKQDLYGLVLTNRSATGCYVTIRDNATIVEVFYLPPTDTRGMMLPVDSAIPQTAANTAWTATCSSNAIDSVEITALAVKHL